MYPSRSIRLVLLAVVFVLLGMPSAFAQLSAAPSTVHKDTQDIAGSEWVGIDDGDVTTFLFEMGGVLTYAYNGNAYRNGTWSQDGEAISFEMNKNYRKFEGTLKDDMITGISENSTGKKWEMTIYRYRHPNCERGQFVVGSACKSAATAAPAPKIRVKARPKRWSPQKDL